MGGLDSVVGDLSSHTFFARMFLDGEATGAHIRYVGSEEMEIRGLEPELPPNILLEGSQAFVSDDLAPWQEVDSSLGLEAFRLLDPTIVLRAAEVTYEASADSLEFYRCNCYIAATGLNLPSDVIEILGNVREIDFLIFADTLVWMRLRDWLPESDSIIGLRFEGILSTTMG